MQCCSKIWKKQRNTTENLNLRWKAKYFVTLWVANEHDVTDQHKITSALIVTHLFLHPWPIYMKNHVNRSFFFFTSTDSSSLDILVEIYYHGSEGIQQPTLPAKEDMQSLSQKQLDTMISLCHCSNNEWQLVTEKYAESRIIRVCTSHERWRE